MRTPLFAIAHAALAGLASTDAHPYPTRPVTVIVPFAAGGPADITGRIVADIFSKALGQQFMVENVAGAGGATGKIAPRAPRPTATRSRWAIWERMPRRSHRGPTSPTSRTSISSRSA